MIYTVLTIRPAIINISISLKIEFILLSWPTINKIKGFIPFERCNAIFLAVSLNLKITSKT